MIGRKTKKRISSIIVGITTLLLPVGLMANYSEKGRYAKELYKEAATFPFIRDSYKRDLIDEASRVESKRSDLIDLIPFSSFFSDRYDLERFKQRRHE
jgi:hypothetical protein